VSTWDSVPLSEGLIRLTLLRARTPISPSLRRRGAVCAALAVSTLAGVAMSATSASSSVAQRAVVPPASFDAGTVRMTQANLLSGQPINKLKRDVATVLGPRPDFVTYNEVAYRSDALLAPPGYALWRTPGKYKGANPVAWRTDRWTAIDQGTTMISNRRGREPGQSVEWGIRFANWVTLQGVDGRVVSVVSTHLAPMNSITEGLTPISVRRLGALTTTLSAAGPVLVGGDFNVHYKEARYPRDLFEAFALTPTYDVVGRYFATGDHRGATIDYLFLNEASDFAVQGQYNTELNSDHDAITADLAFTEPVGDMPVMFSAGTVVNNPSGDRLARRAVLELMIRALDNAPRASAVHLQTKGLRDRRLTAALLDAADRGVHVQLVTRHERFNRQERQLQAELGWRTTHKSWVTDCVKKCRRLANAGRLPDTQLLVSKAGETPALLIEADAPAERGYARQQTAARVDTSKVAYDAAFRLFFKLIGREI
jgi:endonuclease/exonuclease/phosphatase (EEP) superfamily protein YafD